MAQARRYAAPAGLAECADPDLRLTDPNTYLIVESFPDDLKIRFTNTALAMDLALNVADKVLLKPILIEPPNTLAGNPLYGFAGFLVPEFRARDFEQGRFDTWQTWQTIAQKEPGEFYMPAPGDPKYPPPIAPGVASFADDALR
jgi:hypothetical protein